MWEVFFDNFVKGSGREVDCKLKIEIFGKFIFDRLCSPLLIFPNSRGVGARLNGRNRRGSHSERESHRSTYTQIYRETRDIHSPTHNHREKQAHVNTQNRNGIYRDTKIYGHTDTHRHRDKDIRRHINTGRKVFLELVPNLCVHYGDVSDIWGVRYRKGWL